VEQLVNVVAVVPNLKGLADQVADAADGPSKVTMSQWNLSQEIPKLSVLIWVDRAGGSGQRSLRDALALQTGLPTVDGVEGNAEVLHDLGVEGMSS